jgi:hypothetical protein
VPNFARRDDIALQQVGGDSVLTDPRTQLTHVINATAAWVWDQLDGSATTEAIAARLAERYAIPVDTARRDVERITSSFQSLGLFVP